MLIVIAIIGIIIAILLTTLNASTQQKKVRDAKRRFDIEDLIKALELYRFDNGTYPSSDQLKDLWGTDLPLEKDGFVYLTKLPKDPLKDSEFSYDYLAFPEGCGETPDSPPCTDYVLVAKLEDDKINNTYVGRPGGGSIVNVDPPETGSIAHLLATPTPQETASLPPATDPNPPAQDPTSPPAPTTAPTSPPPPTTAPPAPTTPPPNPLLTPTPTLSS